MYYTVISASDDQIQSLLEKHLRNPSSKLPVINKLIDKSNGIISSKFSYDSEDNIGFVTLKTWTGKTVSYQLRSNSPCFVSFTGFGNISISTWRNVRNIKESRNFG